MDTNLEYRLRIIPAQAGQPWQAILEGNGVVLRFSSLLELMGYLERVRPKIVSAKQIPMLPASAMPQRPVLPNQ
jgi:hypothetical protein